MLLAPGKLSQRKEDRRSFNKRSASYEDFYIIAFYLKCRSNQHKDLLLPNTKPTCEGFLNRYIKNTPR